MIKNMYDYKSTFKSQKKKKPTLCFPQVRVFIPPRVYMAVSMNCIVDAKQVADVNKPSQEEHMDINKLKGGFLMRSGKEFCCQ